MYTVTNSYKEACKKSVQKFRITGTINDVSFNDLNVLKDTFIIENGNNAYAIGQLYIGCLTAVFVGLNLDAKTLKGKQIIPKMGLMLKDGTYEDIPLGVYNITEVVLTVEGISVKAYDNVSRLSRKCLTENIEDSAYQIVKTVADSCKLKLADTEEEFENLCNGIEPLELYETNNIETCLDLVTWLAQTMCCNVYADRDGKLVFKQFNDTAIDTIDVSHRFMGANFSDYITKYTGLSCVNIEEMTTSYYGNETDDGLSYNLGSNPFLQGEDKDTLRKNILESLAPINYASFSADIMCNPSYDLMDVFYFTGGLANICYSYCMTHFVFKYGDLMTIEGTGKDASLATGRSKSGKNLSGLFMGSSNASLDVKSFTNSSEIQLSSQDTELISVTFSTKSNTTLLCLAKIILDLTTEKEDKSAEGTTNITIPGEGVGASQTVSATVPVYWQEDTPTKCSGDLQLNNIVVSDSYVAETYTSGKHTLNIVCTIDTKAGESNTLILFSKVDSGSATVYPSESEIILVGSGIKQSTTQSEEMNEKVSYKLARGTMKIAKYDDTLNTKTTGGDTNENS